MYTLLFTKIILSLIINCCSFTINGQQLSNELQTLGYIYQLDFKNSRASLTTIIDKENRISVNNLLQIIEHRGQKKEQDSLIIESLLIDKEDTFNSIISNLTKGFYLVNNTKNNSEALHYFNNALQNAEELDNELLIKLSLVGILDLHSVQVVHNNEDYKSFLKYFDHISKTSYDKLLGCYYKNTFHSLSIYSPKDFFSSSTQLIHLEKENKNSSPAIKGKIYDNISVYYRVIKQNDSAVLFSEKIIALPDNTYNNRSKLNAYMELATLAANNNKNKEAKNYINKAKGFNYASDSVQTNYTINRFKAIYVHAPLKEYDSAYYYLDKALQYEADQNFKENKEKISQLNVQLKTAEKEKQVLKEQTLKKRNQNIAIGLGGILLLGSIIAFLVYRNTKRKQRIAEQDRELQIQKTETILKEKELETINAMISGQEKERLRIAGELHDNIGSTLAMVRMQVENLERNLDKIENPKALLHKTNDLVDKTYKKIRTLSHERNSGVLAKDGLLPAIRKLARTVSSNNKLQVDVQDFGLEDRIPNKLEITIFRIIQELVTNIIKHAQATEANISLTQHDNELNIMVEDNGKGFKVGKLKEKDGMGLGSIERRIEHLEGTMEVDSTIGRGTSVSLDIPL